MPWCDPCSQFHDPPTVDGKRCPTCGGDTLTLDEPQDEVDEATTVGQSAPWHFWLVVIALAGYLLWRFVDFLGWLIGQL